MPRLSLKQTAYNAIKEKILTCEYEPNSFLTEDILCTDLQMSRTPVRDALSRMEQEHLIRIVPKKGFFVAPLSINEINMVFEGRLLLEPYIIRTYCQRLKEDTLEEMRRFLKEEKASIAQNHDDIYTLDHEFHKCIVSQCGNRYFLQLYEDLHNQNSRLRVLSGASSETRLSCTLEEHVLIFTELSKNNPENAALAMEQHLHNSKEAAFQSFLQSNSYL